MTPTFAHAVDPIILEVLEVVDEIADKPALPPATILRGFTSVSRLRKTRSARSRDGSWRNTRWRAGPTSS